jgi:hypothetical protein
LERLARILVHAGHSPTELAREFREICGRLKRPSQRWNESHLAYFVDLTHVNTLWHDDPEYLDFAGKPIALPLRGRGRSLKTLIERALPGEDPKAVARTLVRVRAIRRRRGLYQPTERYVVYQSARARLHGLTALLGMLRTVEHNVARGRKSAPMLERTALNPSFPVNELPAFHRRLNAAAEEILWTLDADMRRREASHRAGSRTRLGVGIYAFEEPVRRQRDPARHGRSRRGRP